MTTDLPDPVDHPDDPVAGVPLWVARSVRAAGWPPIAVFALHLVIARGFSGYERLPAIDIPMHFLGGVAIASFFRRAVGEGEALGLLGRLTDLGRALFTLAATGTAALVWEFAEWSSDRLGVSRAQLGLGDTLLDMLLGLVGGGAYLLVRRRLGRGALAAQEPGAERPATGTER